MPEGHAVHRTAEKFAAEFLAKTVFVDSPQGRFSTAASIISDQRVLASRAVGKQLFVTFANQQVLRVHLGIYGKWNWIKGSESVSRSLSEVPKGQVRARFFTDSALAELRGPTACEVISVEEADEHIRNLGPDPLNPDPNGDEADRFCRFVLSSRTPIGLLLMNQKVIAGVGNVYRAELLFRARIDPYTPGEKLTRKVVLALWLDAVALLRVGKKHGIMITRDELFDKNPAKSDRYFVYKREQQPCRICNRPVSLAIESGRKLYWCPKCQK